MHVTGWTRDDHRRRLEGGPFDVVVVGGGIVGAGVALDLSARGATVALLERDDLAAGTSSRSTKLFHGGIRYLPHLDFRLVGEGLLEQKVLARIAPYLYHPLEFLVPIYRGRRIADLPAWAGHPRLAPIALRTGLFLYDLLGRRPRGSHRRLSADDLRAMLPSLRAEDLRVGFGYMDAQTDDARLTIAVAKTAVRRGAVVATKVEVRTARRDGDTYVVDAVDRTDGSTLAVRGRAVVAATGPFDPPPLEDDGAPLPIVRSKGTHLILDRAALDVGDHAVLLPETDDGRVLFVIPWEGMTLVGTTDTPYAGDPAHPAASPEDVDYLMRHLRRYFDIPDVDPVSTFAGLRALVGARGSTAKASREHEVVELAPGYVQVAGGKLTTYRRIAAEAADVAADAIGLDRPSPTATLPLVGAEEAPRDLGDRLAAVGLGPSVLERLRRRYGSLATHIVELLEEEPSLRRTIGDGEATLADVVHAVRHEAAVGLADVLVRRTHVAWFTKDHGRADAPAVADVMGRELGWSPTEREAALAAYETGLRAEGL